MKKLLQVVGVAGLVGLLGGCTPSEMLKPDEQKPVVAAHVDDFLDHLCKVPRPAKDDDIARRMRQLRAKLMLAAATRYGVARIEDYAADKKGYAANLAQAVDRSVGTLNSLRKDVGLDMSLYETHKADAIIAMIEVIDAATRSTTERARNFALSPNFSAGKKILENALKDVIYEQSYSADCGEWMEQIQTARESKANGELALQLLDKANSEANWHLEEQCNKVSEMSGLVLTCIQPGI